MCDSQHALVKVYFYYRMYKTVCEELLTFCLCQPIWGIIKYNAFILSWLFFFRTSESQSIPVIFSPDESITSIALLSDVTQTISFLCKELSPAALSWYTRASGKKTWFTSHAIMALQRSEEQNSDFERLLLGTSLLRGQAKVQNLQYDLIGCVS